MFPAGKKARLFQKSFEYFNCDVLESYRHPATEPHPSPGGY